MTHITQYLEWKSVRYPRAAVNYRIWLLRFQELTQKDYATSELDTMKFHNLIADRYAPATVKFAMIALNNYHKYLFKKGIGCLDPYFIEVPKAVSHRRYVPKHNEYEKVMGNIGENEWVSLRDKLILSMLHDTGVRVSELCDIKIGDLEWEKKRGLVRRTRKSGLVRTIYWGDECNRLLLRYLPMRIELGHNDYLFVGRNTGTSRMKLSTRTVERVLQKRCKEAAVHPFSPHGLRHKWASDRRDMAAPVSFIARGLGHANVASALVYQQYNDLAFEEEAQSYLDMVSE